METVNNLASAASRAIWGESNGTQTNDTRTNENETAGQEPVSGETGNVKAGEPYDKGNLAGHVEPTSKPANDEPVTNTTTLPSRPAVGDGEKVKEVPNSVEENKADPASAPQDTQKQQGADRPTETPSSADERFAATKAEAYEAAKVNTISPDPKSLEEKARESGGVLGAGGKEGGDEKEESKGTGEKYVKSSGFVAEGGDFDASKPGAGREADRLLEEKGIHRESAGEIPPAAKEDFEVKASKPKLSEKIKAKLHIGSKDKD